LHPWLRLLLYLAVVLGPMVLMRLAERFAGDATGASRLTIEQLSPDVEGFAEWFTFGFIFFVTWIMSRIEDHSVFDYGLGLSTRTIRRLLLGAFFGVLCMCLLIFTLWSTHHLIFAGVLQHGPAALKNGIEWAVVFVGVGFFEEFFFRGYLLFIITLCVAELLRKLMHRDMDAAAFCIAAVLTSFSFSFVHSANPGESPIGLLCAGLAGLVFAFSLWRTGSLWWAIGFHTAWDWVQSFLFGVADSGGVSAGRLVSSHPSGSALMSGGSTGPEGSLFVLPMLLLIALIVIMTLPQDTRTSTLPWPNAETYIASEVNSAEG
jgi:hypothetical protein